MSNVRRVTRKVTNEQIRRYEGLVFKTTALIDSKVELDFDDIRQRLRLKVWRALELYDPGCGMSEQNYVFMCVMSQKKDLLKRVKHGTLYIEDIAPAETSGGEDAFRRGARDRFDERYLSVCAEEEYAVVEEGELALPDTLTPVEKTIVGYLVEGFMQTETAAKLGLTKGQMESAVRRIRLKLTLWLGRDPAQQRDELQRASA